MAIFLIIGSIVIFLSFFFFMDDFSDQEKSKNQNYASYLNLVNTKIWIDSYIVFSFLVS
jgi:hypothetical protein